MRHVKSSIELKYSSKLVAMMAKWVVDLSNSFPYVAVLIELTLEEACDGLIAICLLRLAGLSSKTFGAAPTAGNRVTTEGIVRNLESVNQVESRFRLLTAARDLLSSSLSY